MWGTTSSLRLWGRIYSIGVRTKVSHDYNGIHHLIQNENIQELSHLSHESVRIELELLISTDINFAAYEELIKDTYRQVIYKIRIRVNDPDDAIDVEESYYKLFTDALHEAGHPIPMNELS